MFLFVCLFVLPFVPGDLSKGNNNRRRTGQEPYCNSDYIFQVRVLTQTLVALVELIKGNASIILFGCFTNVLRAVKFVLEELVSNTYM